jgi:hypothetical protein
MNEYVKRVVHETLKKTLTSSNFQGLGGKNNAAPAAPTAPPQPKQTSQTTTSAKSPKQ